MHHTGGPGWRITMDTSGPMLIALYIRDAAGLDTAGHPALCHVAPKIRAADHSHLTAEVGGPAALKTEWDGMVGTAAEGPARKCPPGLPRRLPCVQQFAGPPARVQAHFGAALTWARERRGEYRTLEAEREANGNNELLADMVEDRLLDVGRASKDFGLTIIELPLAEPRAWYLEPDKIIMSHELLSQPELFRSYVQPVVDLLV